MPGRMSWLRSRPVCAWFLTLALVAGFALHGVRAAHMKAAMPVAALQGPMPDGCDGCDEAGQASAACSLLCAGFVAVAPAAAGPRITGSSVAFALADVDGRSVHGPPDPGPQKSPS